MGPALDGCRERVLDGVLGALQIAECPREDRDRAPPLLAEGSRELLYERASEGICMTGRTSIEPKLADGILAAQRVASSAESTSIR